MTEPSSNTADASERASTPEPEPIAFNVKAASDAKYSLSLPPTATITEVKKKLAEISEVPVERQRLIYSGRVMKNDETLGFYKIKSGHTVHMVKGALSSANASSGGSPATPGSSGVPRNLAAGSGNNPLAGLTGARYAGHVQLPSADMFGPDGGMGVTPDPEILAQTMANPLFQAQINEMLQNPQLLDYIIASNPMLQSMGPEARQLMQSDVFRQMMTSPETLLQMSRMSRSMGGTAPSFPEPGATDTTPAQQGGNQQPAPGQSQQQVPPANPFASIFGMQDQTVPPDFSGIHPPGSGRSLNSAMAHAWLATPRGREAMARAQAGSTSPDAPLNPVAQALLQTLNADPPASVGTSPNTSQSNPFASLTGGMPSIRPAATAGPPSDSRPPEEIYAEQLSQLNDMGFFDFDRNIAALRMCGGNLQAAIHRLL